MPRLGLRGPCRKGAGAAQVHDEVILEGPEKNKQEALQEVKRRDCGQRRPFARIVVRA